MRLGYFPGCSLHGTAREYEESLKAVAAALHIELEEIRDWACCGATSAHATSRTLGVALPARTLMQAEKQNLDRIFAPCAACYNRLASAQHALAHDATMASQIRSILDYSPKTSVSIINIAQLLSAQAGEIQKNSKAPLNGLKIACYYGCLLVRPPEVCKFDDPEAPNSLDHIVSATGAAPVAWDMALECCGGGFSLSRTASVVRLSRAILKSARSAGAHALAVACPMCHSNLDFRQQAINKRNRDGEAMPILFLSQLVGLSLGLDPIQLGLHRHFVSPQPLLDRIGMGKLQPERREQV